MTHVAANPFFWTALGGLAVFETLDAAAALLGLRAVRRYVADDADGRRLEEYTAANTRAGLLESAFGFAVLLLFWLGGGFGALNGLIAGRRAGPVAGGVLFVGILWAGRWLLSLPFGVHHTFGVEQRFGFNKTTPSTYAADQVKALLLAVLLGGPALAVVLGLLEYGGERAWLFAWLFSSVLVVVFAFLAPAVIMPLFNKFAPLEEGGLKEAILGYARSNAFPMQDVFVMDGSKRSTRANAFFTGFGATRKVVLFDTLIRNHTTGELVAVLAHEIGHYKLRHILKKLAGGITNIGLFLFLASLLIHNGAFAAAFGMTTAPFYGGFAAFLIAYGPVGRLLSLGAGWQSRRHEYAADRFAVETTGESKPMVDALRKLSSDNLSNPGPHPLQVVLHYSHPPLAQRVAAIQAVPSGN